MHRKKQLIQRFILLLCAFMLAGVVNTYAESSENKNLRNTENLVNKSNDFEENDIANSWRYVNGEKIEIGNPAQANNMISTFSMNPGEAKSKGIDVSYHQGTISWSTVKPNIDFAIIRCGFGKNITSQDDKQWEANVSACERLGIPYGVYLYSYALDTAGAESEAQHALRLLSGHSPTLPVFYDLEDKTIQNGCSKSQILEHAKVFCNAIQNAGYKAGVYANKYWWTTYLTSSEYNQWERWVAQYNSTCTYSGSHNYWQYTDAGSVPGISGNVDMNYSKLTFGSSVVVPDEQDEIEYYPACSSSYTSLIDGLKSIGVDSSFSNRKKIAALNDISDYSGTAAQNTQMLNLLKQGKLIKARHTKSEPSYSDFSVSQSVYSLHDKIEFKINPINMTGMGITIDKEGVGNVVAEGCNGTNGHTLWGIGLGAGKYSAHITVYNDEKWVDTETVYFSVVAPSYSNLEINKKKIGTAEEAKFSICTDHAEFMVLKIDKEGEGCVYTERCDSLNSWSVKADTLGVGEYKAHFLVFSTNDYYIETDEIAFSIYQSPEKSKLSCLPGNSHTKTIFQWEKAANTVYYDLRIDAADYETGGNIKNVWQLRGNRCSVWLPTGEYAAHVDSVNEDGAVGGEIIYFTVEEGDGTPADLGEEIKAEIVAVNGSAFITNGGEEVKLENGNKEDINQIWKFVKQEDGSYVIFSEAGNGVLTASDESNQGISVTEYQNLERQKWKLYGDEDGYVFQSVGTDQVIGLPGQGNVNVLGGYTLKYSEDQMFLIRKAASIPNKPALSVSSKNGILTATVSNTDHVIEYGFVYGEQEDVMLSISGRTRIAYSEMDANGCYSLDASGMAGYAIRAYVVYMDKNGVSQIIYSDQVER